jgi:hypothetical protein
MLAASSHQGTVAGIPKGILAIITTGEKKGTMLLHVAIEPTGCLITCIIMTIARTIGIVTGSIRLWVSWASSLIALPTAANNDA